MPVTLFDNDYTYPNQHRYTLHEIVEGFGLSLGLDDYPIFDEAYRDTLNQRIYEHFEYRRIASLTPQLFVFYLNRRMRENMPTYNALYEKLKNTTDPFNTYEQDSSGENEAASHGRSEESANSTSTSDATATGSNTPASYLENPTDPKYMSSLTQNKGTSTSESSANSSNDGTNSSNYVGRVRARSGYLGDSVMSAIATGFLNVDLAVCDMLEPCFMQLWDDQPIF